MNEKILIVDDETSIADLMKDALNFEGFDCHSLYSGNQAIEYLSSNDVDLVISDVRMPDGDGFILLQYINSLKQNRPKLIFITGNSGYSDEKLKAQGAMNVHLKPLLLDKFILEIKNIFSLSA